MHNRSVLKNHAALVDQMAETLGVDLEEVTLRGDLQISDISDAVLRCVDCTHSKACQGWMKEQNDGAMQTPDYCRNSEMFRKLRKAMEQ